MAEFDRTYASNGKGNAALTLGIIGTGLSAFGNGLMNGGFGGLFGNGGNVAAVVADKKDEKIDFLSDELMREKCERYTDKQICELKSLMYDKFEGVNSQLCAQNVWNATNTSTITCLTNQINQLNSLLTYGISSSKVISSSSSS